MGFFGGNKKTTQQTPEQVADKQQEQVVYNPDPHKESINFKCEQFLGKNWKYVFCCVALVGLVGAYELNQISKRMKNLEDVVRENNEKVVMTTTDGRAVRVSKEPLRAELLKAYAIGVFVNNFVVSRTQLTDNFNNVKFQKYSDVIDNVRTLKLIYEEYIDTENTETKKADKAAIGDFTAYLQWLISAVAQDKLPEYILIKDFIVDKYQYDGNQFELSITLKVTAQSYILARNSYFSQEGTFGIVAKGSFSLENSSDVNPYGMRIHRMKFSPMVKNTSVGVQ